MRPQVVNTTELDMAQSYAMDAAVTVSVSSDDVAMNDSVDTPETNDSTHQSVQSDGLDNANESESTSQSPKSNVRTHPVWNCNQTVRFDNSWL